MLHRIYFLVSFFLFTLATENFISMDSFAAHAKTIENCCNQMSESVLPEGLRIVFRGDFDELVRYFNREHIDKTGRHLYFKKLYDREFKDTLEELRAVLRSAIKDRTPKDLVVYSIIYWILRPGSITNEPFSLVCIDRILRHGNMKESDLSDMKEMCSRLVDYFSRLQPNEFLNGSTINLFKNRTSILITLIDKELIERRDFGDPNAFISPPPSIQHDSRPPSSNCQLGDATREVPIPGRGSTSSAPGGSPTVGSAPR